MELREMLPDGSYADVVATVRQANEHMTLATARRVVDEALKYVCAASKNPGVYVQPSNVVDEGWHALILHTAPYAELCEKLGRFVDHYPERPGPGRYDPEAMERTVALLQDAGLKPDRALWTEADKALVPVSANCSHTPKPGGCGPIRPGKCGTHG